MAEAAVELRAILDSAERAASVQDFASAEHYLRQAAVIQEAQVGPTHPELANTLNNLGIVLERLGKPADAEASYRRAYAIASATLAADDPLVITSGQNLRDFCAAAGKPFEIAPPPPPAAVTPTPPAVVTPPPAAPVATTASKPVETKAAAAAAPPVKPAATPTPSSKPVATKGSKPVAARPTKPIAAKPSRPAPAPAAPAVTRSAVRAQSSAATRRHSLIWLGIATVVVVLAILWWFTSSSRTGTDNTATPPPAAAVPAPSTGTAPATNIAPATDIAPAPEPAAAATPPAREEPAPATTVPAASRPPSPAAVSLVEARLCRPLSLSDWQCTPVSSPAAPGGRMFFYTRVKSSSDTTVQHRWYVNDGLLQSVNLRVRANSGAGFRTYSRNTVTAERRGTWRLELRDADGALLHEERFVVQ